MLRARSPAPEETEHRVRALRTRSRPGGPRLPPSQNLLPPRGSAGASPSPIASRRQPRRRPSGGGTSRAALGARAHRKPPDLRVRFLKMVLAAHRDARQGRHGKSRWGRARSLTFPLFSDPLTTRLATIADFAATTEPPATRYPPTMRAIPTPHPHRPTIRARRSAIHPMTPRDARPVPRQ